ncbi:hypothetical protein D3C83_289270 [compost metagenome]
MAVGLIVGEAAPKPNDLVHTKEKREPLLDLLARQIGIAVRVEKALLRRHERAAPVDRH